MKISKTTTLSSLAFLLGLSSPALAGPPATSQWVLATAKATGAGGEQFVSSLRIRNPGTTAASVSLTYLPQSPIDGSGTAGGDNSAATPVTLAVPAGQTVAIEDVVLSRFNNPTPFGIAAGGIRVTSDVPVSVLSRTFVANAKSSTGAAGTFGFSIPAQTADEAISVGDTGYITYASTSSAIASGFRTNLILLNTSKSSSSSLTVKLVKGDGTTIGSKDYTLGKWSAAQVGNIANVFGYTQDDTNLTLVITVSSGGPVVVGASIIDNAISSLNYAPPSKIFIARDGYYALLLADGDPPEPYTPGYGFTGRINLAAGKPSWMSAEAVVKGCPVAGGGTTDILFMQAEEGGSFHNSTFARQADGSYKLSGGDSDPGSTSTAPLTGTWTANIFFNPDGTLRGDVTYKRLTGANILCSGGQATLPFVGARAYVPATAP